jgi:hypothetical protein
MVESHDRVSTAAGVISSGTRRSFGQLVIGSAPPTESPVDVLDPFGLVGRWQHHLIMAVRLDFEKCLSV